MDNENISTKTIQDSIFIRSTPHEVYETLMDSEKHSQMIGAQATISREIDGHFSVWGDSIYGENQEIVPDKKIVQSWRASDWPQEHYSKVTFELNEKDGGTELMFTHTDIPQEFVEDVSQGWNDYYWTPMKEMLE